MGVQSANAGLSVACQGCPNQQICSDPTKNIENPGKAFVAEAMKNGRNKLLILSGKGGVGKSTVTMLLSRYLAKSCIDKNFGILDIDICGPSLPRLLGVEGENVHQSGFGWFPVNIEDNIHMFNFYWFLVGITK